RIGDCLLHACGTPAVPLSEVALASNPCREPLPAAYPIPGSAGNQTVKPWSVIQKTVRPPSANACGKKRPNPTLYEWPRRSFALPPKVPLHDAPALSERGNAGRTAVGPH